MMWTYPWIFAYCIWGVCATCIIVCTRAGVKASRRQRELREQTEATRLAEQDRILERQRREMYRINREHQILMREMRGETPMPQMSQMQWEQSKKKARAYLLEKLDTQQTKDLLTNNWFDVEAKGSGNVYRIFAGNYVGNVHVMKGFGYQAPVFPPHMLSEDPYLAVRDAPRFCCHLYHYGMDYPVDDHLLAQMLMLRNEEDTFLTIAHRMN
jgi:hypothetical protein